ncbi:signal peptidase II [Dinoroseobacter sp. PD6]|uniref:signal peptidase II n=1 Tax=Dinoroseobacter sp. PD6 TaxID=3028384 RepID=UPI00237A5DEC|nr:signal peptidase II [Dinoroseobacter sp. PD6]MDD9718902.1 signal peptidase II [Dinoroseobacter sp. PD6]
MRALALSAVVAFAIDQLSKLVVVHWLNLKEIRAIDVLPPVLNFRMGWNHGVNFGLFGSDSEAMRWALIVLALAICAGVVIWVRREGGGTRVMVSAGLLVGGALANVLDRVIYGAVADFLNMSCCGIRNPFTFNLADVAIFAGALGLVLFTGKTEKNPS